MEGEGEMVWHDGSCFEGGWSEGKRHGKGVYEDVSGSVFDGQWVHGVFQGEGTRTLPNGTLMEGQWEGDCLTCASARRGTHSTHTPDPTSTAWRAFPDAVSTPAALKLNLTPPSLSSPPLSLLAPLSLSPRPLSPRPLSLSPRPLSLLAPLSPHAGGHRRRRQAAYCTAPGARRSGAKTAPNGTTSTRGSGSTASARAQESLSLEGRYEAAWRHNRRHGVGKLVDSHGWTYRGKWSDGQRSGQGVLSSTMGHRFSGEWDNHHLPHGTLTGRFLGTYVGHFRGRAVRSGCSTGTARACGKGCVAISTTASGSTTTTTAWACCGHASPCTRVASARASATATACSSTSTATGMRSSIMTSSAVTASARTILACTSASSATASGTARAHSPRTRACGMWGMGARAAPREGRAKVPRRLVFIGQFANDKKVGAGEFVDGFKSTTGGEIAYYGNYSAGVRHGDGAEWEGVYGDRYMGSFEEGEMRGVGKFNWADGEEYLGCWLAPGARARCRVRWRR